MSMTIKSNRRGSQDDADGGDDEDFLVVRDDR